MAAVRDCMSPVGLEGRSEVEVDWQALIERLQIREYLLGMLKGETTISELDVSQLSPVSMAEVVSVTLVTEDKE